jgi:hypothetical protein
MRCPSCKGSISVTNFLREKTCPACGEKLKRMPTKEQVRESLISFAEDKGYIFWSIAYIFLVWVFAFVEQIVGSGELFEYISEHGKRFFFLAVFSGSIIDYYAKANVEVTNVRNKFIFKPPLYLRNYRRWTNIFLLIGFGTSYFLLHRFPGYISPLPMITFMTTFSLCTAWAIMGLVVTEDDLNDKRIRYFFDEMRVSRVKKYNRASALYIGGLFVAGVSYYILVRISGLWWYIHNSRIVYNTVTFWKTYFAWTKQFTD